MKWLLITVIHGNPGDILIRRGVERLILSVDKQATFDLLAKNQTSTWTPRPFDRAVVCGMPMFWHEEFTKTEDMDWWHLLMNGWVSRDRRRIMALGVGSCCSTPGRAALADRYIGDAEKAMWKVVLRDRYIPNYNAEVVCCPAIITPSGHVSGKQGKPLVNLMPDGGHWTEFNPREAAVWREKYPELIRRFSAAGWTFVAHEQRVLDAAITAGWSGEHILADTAERMAETYARCSAYFGNRVHGAIATLANASPAVCVGYDSRRYAVAQAGGVCMLPSEVNVEADVIPAKRSRSLVSRVVDLRRRLQEIVTEFAQ